GGGIAEAGGQRSAIRRGLAHRLQGHRVARKVSRSETASAVHRREQGQLEESTRVRFDRGTLIESCSEANEEARAYGKTRGLRFGLRAYNACMKDLVTILQSGKVLVMDGAMGTELLRLTRSSSLGCGEAYNLGQGDFVRSIHQAYLDAGADVILTNTFQASPDALATCDLVEHHHEIWQAAIGLAHLDHPRPHYILADIGPIENLTLKIAEDTLAECVDVDAILLETWSSPGALKRFVDRRNSARLPLLASFTFHRTNDLLTFKGISPEHCAR